MVVSSAKITVMISWSPICILLVLLSTSMKLASASAAIINNSIERRHPWRIPHIRVKRSDRRPFISILDWMLVYATFFMRMNLSPYSNFCKAEKIKSQSTLSKALGKSKDIKKGFYSVYLTH